MNTTIEGADGQPLPAIDIGIPGLVIARAHDTDGLPIYSVTHVRSKACVCWFDNPETAAKAATELAALGDWTADAATVKANIDVEARRRIKVANGGSDLCTPGAIRD